MPGRLWYMGQRTSVYLSDELKAAVKASGVPLAELVRRGLGVAAPEPSLIPPGSKGMYLDPRQIPTELKHPAMDAGQPASSVNCSHRGLRPGAWCKGCQSVVPERRKS